MSNKIGRFEILSELAKSPMASVYKATDPESGQTVALKAIKLELLGEQSATLLQHTLEEAEATKSLNSHNIAVLYGAGEIEGQLCASMEYVQGNSIATMLARKEGFSIWDIQDIARQTCQGLEHAHSKKVVHYCLEPAKIMVGWDGITKMLGFGVSTMGAFAAQATGKPPDVLHYMSPEQLRGDPLDARSNLFTLGAILYEMVTERKAFEGEDSEQVRQTIAEMTPVAPDQINRKIHPALSEVIMKALAKAPEERYQSGQELVTDLERCKESSTKAAAKKPAQPPQGLQIPGQQKPAPAASAPKAAPRVAASAVPAAPAKPVAAKAPQPSAAPAATFAPNAPAAVPAAKSVAAAAGWGSGPESTTPRAPKLDPSAQFITSCVKASVEALSHEEATMSSAPVIEPERETPKIAVDPMMDESRQNTGAAARSFSEIDELPPLKEIYIAPPPPPVEEAQPAAHPASPPGATMYKETAPEKQKIQPREVAKKAVTEIKKTPPKLFAYSIGAAVVIILLVVTMIAFKIHSENADEDSGPTPSATAAAVPASSSAAAAPGNPAQAPGTVQVEPEPVTGEPANVSVQPRYNKKKVKAPLPEPAIVAGNLNISSTPEGAQVQIDGRSDPSWVTPNLIQGLTPGHHTVSVSKPGFGPETRTIEVGAGSKFILVVQLAQLTATVSVASEPAGAAVWIDGKDTGKVTPALVPVDKPGNHALLIKKQGYLDDTTTANLQFGQTFHYAPALQALGSTDDIKVKKLFGGGAAGMGKVNIKTQPKGAQIAVNNRVLDKGTPLEFYLNPGNYVIDITMSGYKSLHRVVKVEKNGKVAIEESLDRE